VSIRTVTQVGQGGGDVPAGACVITDALGPMSLTLADSNALPTDAVSFTFQFPETNAGQTDASSFRITGFDDTNAEQTDDFAITTIFAETNAGETDAATFTLFPTYQETDDVQSETLGLTISGFADTNSLPTEAATAKVRFNASGTFTVPTGITSVIVECWAGGAGGAPDGALNGGNGGGGGAYSRSTLTVVGGNSYTVTVGAGGASNAAGGDSWFSTNATILAKGGTISTGGQASAGIGDVKFNGGDGAAGAAAGVGGGGGGGAGDANNGGNASGQTGGTGGVADGGNGGNGGATSTVGGSGVQPGGGGGGGGFNVLGTTNGGPGAAGRVTVQWTLA
jgi:hypothetical protein